MSSSILNKIVVNKHQELVERKQRLNIGQLTNDLVVSQRSLKQALSGDKSDFIFECKKASPSKGLIRENYDLDEILNGYRRFASAISVLTDHKYFGGSFEHLAYVSQQVTQPVLCKDFFVDPYQVYEARYHGADAILLMLSVLSDGQYKELANVAHKLNLDVLTEVHDHAEMQRAIALDAKIIGINNRNLKDLSIDLETTSKLIEGLSEIDKKGRTFISESGIHKHSQVKKIAPLVDGFLVGSSIMEHPDITTQCKALIYGLVKICGISDKYIARIAEESGASYGGLIFYNKSPRSVNLEQAKKIIADNTLDFVAVFVNSKLSEVIDIVTALEITIIQLHGDEDVEYIKSLRQSLPDRKIWKAIKMQDGLTVNEATSLTQLPVDRLLLDSFSKNAIGGTGESFNWNNLDLFERSSIVLAGGLNIDNIEQAASKAVFCLDVNSGVETGPGKKSAAKITAIFNQLHA